MGGDSGHDAVAPKLGFCTPIQIFFRGQMEKKEQDQVEEMLARLMNRFQGQVIEALDQRIGVLKESFQHKLDLVVAGQQM